MKIFLISFKYINITLVAIFAFGQHVKHVLNVYLSLRWERHQATRISKND